MEFTPLLENIYHTNFLITLAMILVIVVGIIFLIVFLVAFGETEASKRSGALGGSLIVFGIIASITVSNLSFDIDAKNRAITEANLAKKYNIEDVLWKEWATQVEDTSGQRLIAVQDKSGDILSYRYSLDEVTSEPTLMNIPDGFKQTSKKPVSEIINK
jgi:hypothetical protein